MDKLGLRWNDIDEGISARITGYCGSFEITDNKDNKIVPLTEKSYALYLAPDGEMGLGAPIGEHKTVYAAIRAAQCIADFFSKS